MPRHRKIKQAVSVHDQENDPVNMTADDEEENGFIRMLPPVDVFTYKSLPPATYRPAAPAPSLSDQDRIALIQMLRKKLNELNEIEGNAPNI